MYIPSLYVDACFLLAYQKWRERGVAAEIGKHAKSVLDKAKYNQTKKRIQIKIPNVILGESLRECCEQDYDPSEIVELLSNLNADTPVPDIEIWNLAIDIRKRDILEPCDAIFVSHALHDSTSIWLLTTDEKILYNHRLTTLKNDIRPQLRISDRI